MAKTRKQEREKKMKVKVSQEEKEKRYELLKKIHQHDLRKAFPDEDLPSIEDICIPDWKPYACGTHWRVNDYTWWVLMLHEGDGVRYAHIYREGGKGKHLEEYERMYVIDKNYLIIRPISPEEYYSKPMKPLEFWKDDDCVNNIRDVIFTRIRKKEVK